MYTIPYRHIHLDFHTSGLIEGLGKDFNKDDFKQALVDGHIDSITLCAKCHHGWMYYPSKEFPTHPHMKLDLFGEMLQVAKELGLSVEAYLSVGYDEVIALEQSQYLMRKPDQRLDSTADFLTPGYHQFCMNTPYLDRVCSQVEEVLSLYQVDGIFLDIVGVRSCYCPSCMQEARARNINPLDEKAMATIWEDTYFHYIERIKQSVERVQPGIEIFHNSGHINRGRRDLMDVNSHLELESLPTGGWGYDHFLVSSRFVQHFGKPYLGMTGRFQFGWGDFGGYKHPNGMRYEVSRFLAHGAGCSIGDQMHPYGKLDPGLYRMIGEVYGEVEKKQPWCTQVQAIADIAILSIESAGNYAISGVNDSLMQGSPDIGAARILTEGHYLFDVLAREDDFSTYQVLILPDRVHVTADLEQRLLSYLDQGGKLFATGSSACSESGDLARRLGIITKGANPSLPNYAAPCFKAGSLDAGSFVMYQGSQEMEIVDSSCTILANLEESFFNRSLEHFSSHYHTASSLTPKGPGMVHNQGGVCAVWNLFSEYALKGNLAAKYMVLEALRLLVDEPTIITTYPSQVELSLMHQQHQCRYILHVLHGSRVLHGKHMEVVEDCISLPASPISLSVDNQIEEVRLVPQNISIPFSYTKQRLEFTIPPVACHQMVCLTYGEN